MEQQPIEPTATERSAAWLAKGGLRPTRQRVVLAQLLVGDGHNRHVTAESLFAAIQQDLQQIPDRRGANYTI